MNTIQSQPKKAKNQSAQECSVCGVVDGKYKCPKCRVSYCSVTCCKKHKESCSVLLESSTAISKEQSRKMLGVKESKYLLADELTRDPLENAIRRRKICEENEDDLEEGWSITTQMMDMLDNSEWLRKELEDGGLRQLIAEIDCADDVEDGLTQNNSRTYRKSPKLGAKPELSQREIVFMRIKQTNPKFSEFIDKLLLLAGVLQKEEDPNEPINKFLQIEGKDSLGHVTLVPIPKRRKALGNIEQMKNEKSMTSESDESESDESESESDEESSSSSSSNTSEEAKS